MNLKTWATFLAELDEAVGEAEVRLRVGLDGNLLIDVLWWGDAGTSGYCYRTAITPFELDSLVDQNCVLNKIKHAVLTEAVKL